MKYRSRTSNEGTSAEGGRRPETHSGSTAFEFFPLQREVQDADDKNHHVSGPGGGLVCHHRPKDAYFHIQVVQRHRRFLRFAFGGKADQYKVLPFGLALAPRTFTKCMDAALAPLRLQGIRVINYLDDWLILAHSRELVSRHRDIVLAHIHSLGLRMNAKKSVLLPSQRTVFLGVHLDSVQMQARLAPARIPDLTACLARPCVAPRVDSHEAIPLVDEGAEVTPHCTSYSPYQGVAQLLSTPFNVARPRFSSERGENGCDPPSPYDHDGCINDRLGRGLRRQTGERGVEGRVPLLAYKRPGTQGCLLGFFLPILGGYHIIVRTDNMAVVSHINRQGGSRLRTLDRLACRLLLWSQDKFLSLRAVHVPGILNLAADFLSRQKLRPGEWMLNRQTVSQIWDLFGKAEVNLFASQESSQCPLWFSLSFPKTLGIDAFAQPWPNVSLYAFPPIKLIPAVWS